MNRYLKKVASSFAVVVASWWLARYWSDHGSWWLAHRPNSFLTAIYVTVKPILSTEVWQAEEQLNFMSFWIPVFVVLTAIIFLSLHIRKYFRVEYD